MRWRRRKRRSWRRKYRSRSRDRVLGENRGGGPGPMWAAKPVWTSSSCSWWLQQLSSSFFNMIARFIKDPNLNRVAVGQNSIPNVKRNTWKSNIAFVALILLRICRYAHKDQSLRDETRTCELSPPFTPLTEPNSLGSCPASCGRHGWLWRRRHGKVSLRLAPISVRPSASVAISSDNNERRGKVGLQISHGTASAGERERGKGVTHI